MDFNRDTFHNLLNSNLGRMVSSSLSQSLRNNGYVDGEIEQSPPTATEEDWEHFNAEVKKVEHLLPGMVQSAVNAIDPLKNRIAELSMYGRHLRDTDASVPISFAEFLLVTRESVVDRHDFQSMIVHELAIKHNGQRCQQRLILTEQQEKLSLGMLCYEYYESKTAYIAYIQSPFGGSPIKHVVQAYADFVALFPDNYQLHIWACPPDPNEYFLFDTNPPPTATPRPAAGSSEPEDPKEALRNRYQNYLNEIDYGTTTYQPRIDIAEMPQFGKKADEEVLQKYKALIKTVSEFKTEFAKLFKPTVVTDLLLFPSLIPAELIASPPQSNGLLDNSDLVRLGYSADPRAGTSRYVQYLREQFPQHFRSVKLSEISDPAKKNARQLNELLQELKTSRLRNFTTATSTPIDAPDVD